jgi:general secretion pathway protein G
MGRTLFHPVTEGPKWSVAGSTLSEVLLSIASCVILGAVFIAAIASYRDSLEKARNATAMADVRTLDREIGAYFLATGKLPNTLAELGRDRLTDPWGNTYEYLNISVNGNRGQGGEQGSQPRRERFLVPLNSNYDLYSKGKDGKSLPPLTAEQSWDDIVRANDGGYVGLVSDF